MGTQVNSASLQSIGCCIATKDYLAVRGSFKGRETDQQLVCATIATANLKFLTEYTPNGTIITPGFISEATLDMSTITVFGVLQGAIIIDGVVVGVLPEATYADLYEVITAVVAAINASYLGYTAIDNGDNTITIHAPGPGTEANGFAVTIQINPTFVNDKTITDAPKAYNQIIHINNAASSFDGFTVIASNATGGPALTANTVTAFKGDATATTDFTVVTLPITIQGYACVYNPVLDRIYIGGFGGTRRIGVITPGWVYNSANDIIIPFTPANPNPTDTLGFNRAYYNATNGAMYFTMPTNSGLYYQSRSVLRIDNDLTQTQIIVAVNYQTTDMRIDPANGNMWLIPITTSPVRNVKIMNTSNTVTTTIAPANYYPTAIEYYPGDGSGGSERMLVAFAPIAPATDFRINTYELDGTLDTAAWYTGAAVINNIFYSSLYNNFIITEGNNVQVLHADGTLKQTFTGLSVNSTGFVQDTDFNYIIGTGTAFLTPSAGTVRFYTLTNDGDESADGALEGGTPDVYQTQDDQCATETLVNSAYQQLNNDCIDCGGTTTISSNTPVQTTYTIYYGNSDDDALDATGVAALTSAVKVGFGGTYSIPLTDPDNYMYFAYPTQLGTPTRLYDADTNFDIACDTAYQVVINYVSYTVYRSYYPLGGGFTLAVTP